LVLVAADRGPELLCVERTVHVRAAQLMARTSVARAGRLAAVQVVPLLSVEKYVLGVGVLSATPHEPAMVQAMNTGLPLPRLVKTRRKLEPKRLQTISESADVLGSCAVPATKQSLGLGHETEVVEAP
jgi:hypothetical protein